MVNFVMASGAEDKLGFCDINLGRQGVVTMQCRQKRFEFYITIISTFNWSLILHLAISCVSIVWCLKRSGLRRITSLMEALRQRPCLAGGSKAEQLVESKGEDFLFLFDLVAHTCGQPATLRVLSFTADTFAVLCQPELESLTMTESSIKITWARAPLQALTGIKQLQLQRYVATIFPYSHNSEQTVRVDSTAAQGGYEVEFHDLAGGKREYVVTLSAIIEDAKMRGVKRVTCLPPHPPSKLMATNLGPGVARVAWSRPKGEFDKYILKVTLLEARKSSEAKRTFSPIRQDTSFKHVRKGRELDEVWLGAEEVGHPLASLKPGERYRLELRSLTGNVTCIEEKVPAAVLVTRPRPPKSVTADTATSEVRVGWGAPEGPGHGFLEGYRVQLREPGGRLVKEVVQSKHSRTTTLTHLPSATEFVVAVAVFCLEDDNRGRENESSAEFLESVSEYQAVAVFTLPLPPTALRLEASTATSLRVKWEAPSTPTETRLSYRVRVQATSPVARERVGEESKDVEAAVYTFSHLEPGETYRVVVEAVVKVGGHSHCSAAATEHFTTKPLPPERLVVEDPTLQLFSWQRSPSTNVRRYKLKIRRGDEKATDYIVADEGEAQVTFQIPLELELGSEYKVNIYSQVLTDAGEVESEPLFMKVTKSEDENDVVEEAADLDAPRDVFDAKEDKPKRRTAIKLHRRKTRAEGDLLDRAAAGGPLSPCPQVGELAQAAGVLRQVSVWRQNNPGEP